MNGGSRAYCDRPATVGTGGRSVGLSGDPAHEKIDEFIRRLVYREFVVARSAKDLLHQVVIDEHAEKRPCGKHRVHWSNASVGNSLPNDVRQHFKSFLGVCSEKTIGQFAVSQGTEQKQARNCSIVGGSIKHVASDFPQHLTEIRLGVDDLANAATAPAPLNAVGEYSPKEVFLGAEMPENYGLGNTCGIGNLAGAGAIEALFREELHRDFDELLLTVDGVESHSKVSKHL